MNRKKKNNIKTNERRAKGEGSLTYLPDRKKNPYRLARYVPDEYGKTVRKQFYGSSEEDCVIKVEEYLRNIQIPSEIRERTISEFIIEHYNAKLAMGKIKGSTYNRKIETLRQIEKADIGQK